MSKITFKEFLVEYKNKYYKPIKKTKPRAKKTLWYNNYDNWVADIKTRFPDARAYYDEENEEIMASSEDSKQCYGKWSKKKKDFQGVSFFKSRNLPIVNKSKRLKRIEDDKKKDEDDGRHSEFSALL